MAVDAYALTTLSDAKEIMRISNSELKRDGITIYCTTSGATASRAQVTDTTLVLVVTGGASAGTDTLTFADANKDTIGELVTAINALTPRTWVANTQCPSASASTDLVIKEATACLGSANETTLDITDNYQLELLINEATAIIERYCGRNFKSRTYYHARYSGIGDDCVVVDHFPITSITSLSVGTYSVLRITNDSTDAAHAYVSVTATSDSSNTFVNKPTSMALTIIGGTNVGVTTIDLTSETYDTLAEIETYINALGKNWSAELVSNDYDNYPSYELIPMGNRECLENSAYIDVIDEPENSYNFDADIGVIYFEGDVFSHGNRNVLITYTAGYSVIPNDLSVACARLAKLGWDNSRRDSSLKKEVMGDHTVELRDSGLTPDIKTLISSYGKVSI